MSRIYRFPDKERRKDEQRLLWLSPTERGVQSGHGGLVERRIDRAGAEGAIHLSQKLMRGEASGLMFAVVRSDGRIELGFSGSLYDNPAIAAGVASQALSLATHWQFDPGDYLPEDP
jgi:hypothetical protein